MNKRIKKKYTPLYYVKFNARVINSKSKHPITIRRNIYNLLLNHHYYIELMMCEYTQLYPKIRFKYIRPIIYPRYQHCPYKTRLIDDKIEK